MKYFQLLLSCMLVSHAALAAEWRGHVAGQWRYFFHDPLPENSEQHSSYAALAAQPEFYHSWDNNDQSLTFTPFARMDQHDEERNHVDIRELVWRNTMENWQLKTGISKVFWGVTESQHLVDVINQSDFVENIDGEDKLGQAMILATLERNWGNMDVFILPGFRERTFPGIEGRPRSFPRVDSDQAQYESSDKDSHIDYALRYYNYLGIWDIGLSWFDGTSRDPLLIPGTDNGQPVLIPYYPQMQQTGLSLQATTDEWLWKLEAIHRSWSAEDFTAFTGGFEYTFVGVMDSNADIGWVAEYLYDDRGQQATTFFQKDLMLGLRLNLNDVDSSEALLGVIVDIDSHESLISLEASRRIGNNWKLETEVRLFRHIDQQSALIALRRDDYIQLELSYYF
ncbi:MAG: hypothetical protein EP315_02780 [Gammaproteobacteria bacterium]|nr:MAG: hypothetical protein EP315_02780 [Gammaproteobacteria bacterium]